MARSSSLFEALCCNFSWRGGDTSRVWPTWGRDWLIYFFYFSPLRLALQPTQEWPALLLIVQMLLRFVMIVAKKKVHTWNDLIILFFRTTAVPLHCSECDLPSLSYLQDFNFPSGVWMSSVVGASLSALLFPFMTQRGRRTHTYARCFARLLFRLMVQITNHIHVWCSCFAALCLVSWIKERSIYSCIVSVLVLRVACLFRRTLVPFLGFSVPVSN